MHVIPANAGISWGRAAALPDETPASAGVTPGKIAL
jgi:hypothetical protein